MIKGGEVDDKEDVGNKQGERLRGNEGGQIGENR